MGIKLSNHFTIKNLLKFSLPSVLMMVFISIYGVVDGYFVSNYAGKTAFAAINYIMPYIMILGSFGFIIGSGGSALIGKTLGEGDSKKANEIFSLLIIFSVIGGIVIAVLGYFTVRPVSKLLGASDDMIDVCEEYGKIISLGIPVVVLQYEFHSFFVTAEKSTFGFVFTLVAGFANIILDYILVGVLDLGVKGAAIATVISEAFGGVLPLIYFACKNGSLLRIGKPVFSLNVIFKTLGNGFSEFVSSISTSVVSMLYNYQLMKYSGEDGVAAYGTLMYVNLVFIAVFIGYSIGTAPIFSYNYGAKNSKEIKNILKKSLLLIGIAAVMMVTCGELLARPFSKIFVGYDEELMNLTIRAFRFFSFTFLLASVPILASSFFTALNDGITSAVISFSRTALFQVVSVLVLPIFLKVDGIWLSMVVAELLSAVLAVILWIVNRKRFGY